ncbi:NnrS family protein [Caenispirillum bisanense]|uniref:Uncharacterized protein involved in response to NO n=1 Tax=Caenispirillum bisanense TaxID=414052 RepID=A0A286GN52_9PROT|nr:NnrS family protein [Caenispirillum bisanense]SOD96922.1 uncharacterized protein involved in response to NO [Caenispirillum bisanense]
MRTVLSYGFRVFFLACAGWGVTAMALWLVWLGVHLNGADFAVMTIALPPFQWHAHEMVFGFGLAAVAGFLLTAVPNWVGGKPIRGAPLGLIAAAWLAGRLAVGFSAWLPAVLVVAVDALFPLLLAGMLARQIIPARQPRNLGVVVVVSLLGTLQVLSLADALALFDNPLAQAPARIGVELLVLLIAVIGGRITPAFTRNWLNARGHAVSVAMGTWLDRAAVALTAAAVLADAAGAPDALRAPLFAAAGVALLVRLSRWHGRQTLAEPLLWVLHLGYGLVAAGFLLMAAAVLGVLVESTALHLWTIGAVGVMVVGVMSRVALGHTGRALTASRTTAVAYGLMVLAAVVRVAGPALSPDLYTPALLTAAGLWMAALVLFLADYAAILACERRVSGP